MSDEPPVLHPAMAFAREFVVTLAAMGVRDVVLSPGSRSGPLAHALVQAASPDRPPGAPEIDLHVRIDERAAGFLAVGLARGTAASGTPAPVAVVTTSGTAVGNLLPAVMEAHHSGLPLILLTADRPGELRGIGANQTTDQQGIFGTFVRLSTNASAPQAGEAPGRAARLAAHAVRTALGPREELEQADAPGPVHVDVEFRDPLGPDAGAWPPVAIPQEPAWHRARMFLRSVGATSKPLPPVREGVVIAGDGAGDVAREVAEAHGWPLLAEPTSGARCGGHGIGRYVALLTSDAGRDLAARVQQVVVIGRPTLSRPITRLIDAAPVLMVAAHGAVWREAPRHAERVLPRVPQEWLAHPRETPDPAWLDAWREAVAGLEAEPTGWSARAVADAWVASLPAGATALVGSSGPIRNVDRVAPVWAVGEAPRLVANRGLAGIDGTVSTAVGLALATGEPTAALLGDVTFLHDAGGLLVGPRERRPDVRLVVVNDGGGRIFGSLEHASADPAHVERVFTTPHGADLGALCAGYGVAHRAVASRGELEAALAQPIVGMSVIEARVAPTG